MDLATITAGGGLEIALFWAIGAFTMGVGALDTWYKAKHNIKRYED